MFSPFLGFNHKEIVGTFAINTAAQSGLAVYQNSGNATALSSGLYGNNFGDVVPATVTTTGTIRELGWLLQPATATGPSVFSVLASIYDESIAAGQNAAVVLSKSGCIIATDQFVSGSGTGAIKFDGTVAINTACGLINGQPRVTQTGDVNRLLFMGQVLQRNITCAVFQII